MAIGFRKLLVLSLIGGIFLLCNAWVVANWLEENGVVGWAHHVRQEYLTGTAITIIIALLILLVKPGSGRFQLMRRCPVCDHVVLGHAKYCTDCGSMI